MKDVTIASTILCIWPCKKRGEVFGKTRKDDVLEVSVTFKNSIRKWGIMRLFGFLEKEKRVFTVTNRRTGESANYSFTELAEVLNGEDFMDYS